jgi:hypothetical protein
MKIYTSTAPLSKELKDALKDAAEGGQDDFLEFLNGRIGVGDADSKKFSLRTASKVIEVTAEPVSDLHEELAKVG